MATKVSSPPPPLTHSNSSPSVHASLHSLPPLNTNSTPRRTNSQRPPSYAKNRMSTFSTTSRASNPSQSRPASHVFPMFHSSLPYTLVRDFAYPVTHPAHYGPPAQNSGLSTPASEIRRLSDPAVSSWDDSRGSWSAGPSWIPDSAPGANTREQLPAMTFTDGGPPYSEDEDLQSPVVTTSRHKKHKSTSGIERGRSPGTANTARGMFVGLSNDGSESYYRTEDQEQYGAGANGPGGEIVTYPPDDARQILLSAQGSGQTPQRDSHFAAGISRRDAPADHEPVDEDGYGYEDNESDADDETRYSRNYSFTIASPDEEMHGKAVALFDFIAENENELGLREGQIILVSYRHGQGWLVAEDPKTGESGLVPEEFVRLVRDIEGGLNGLHTVQVDGVENGNDLLSPASGAPESASTPTHPEFGSSKHSPNPSNGSNQGAGEKHPPVQSSFSTSSKDLEKYHLPVGKNGGEDAAATTPTLPNHPTESR